MSKKKSARSAKKSAASRSASRKKIGPKKHAATKRSSSRVSTSTEKSGTKKKKAAPAKRKATLGRPKVAGTAELDQMFLKDYEARQVFTFLGVKTVKELEEHAPDAIIERLTGPLVKTVERIRKALAVNNRFLAGDEQFAIQFSQLIR